MLLTTTEQVSITTSGGRSTVSVADVSEEEEGEYYCEALNTLGTANSETAELQLACKKFRKYYIFFGKNSFSHVAHFISYSLGFSISAASSRHSCYSWNRYSY